MGGARLRAPSDYSHTAPFPLPNLFPFPSVHGAGSP